LLSGVFVFIERQFAYPYPLEPNHPSNIQARPRIELNRIDIAKVLSFTLPPSEHYRQIESPAAIEFFNRIGQ